MAQSPQDCFNIIEYFLNLIDDINEFSQLFFWKVGCFDQFPQFFKHFVCIGHIKGGYSIIQFP